MNFKKIKTGDVVLVTFPFTDFTGEKKRPALVVSNGIIDGHIWVIFITSKTEIIKDFDIVLKKEDKFFEKTGLKTTSIIRTAKITALDVTIVSDIIGSLSKDIMKLVSKKLGTIAGW